MVEGHVSVNLDSSIHAAPHIKWREALFCESLDIHVFPKDVQTYENIVYTAIALERIRAILKSPITVKSFYRPDLYNRFLREVLGYKTADQSAHIYGMAADFTTLKHQGGVGCDKIRTILLPYLTEIGIRMKDSPGSSHVHIDLKPVVNNRFFRV